MQEPKKEIEIYHRINIENTNIISINDAANQIRALCPDAKDENIYVEADMSYMDEDCTVFVNYYKCIPNANYQSEMIEYKAYIDKSNAELAAREKEWEEICLKEEASRVAKREYKLQRRKERIEKKEVST